MFRKLNLIALIHKTKIQPDFEAMRMTDIILSFSRSCANPSFSVVWDLSLQIKHGLQNQCFRQTNVTPKRMKSMEKSIFFPSDFMVHKQV